MRDAPYELTDKEAEIRAATSYVPRKSSRNGAVIFSIAVFAMTGAVVLGVALVATGGIGLAAIVAALLTALLVLSSTHIALSWEKVVVLRFGKLARVVGPACTSPFPSIEHGTSRVDQRTIATPFYAEKTLTADLVPVTVDACCSGWCGMPRRRAPKWRTTTPPCRFLAPDGHARGCGPFDRGRGGAAPRPAGRRDQGRASRRRPPAGAWTSSRSKVRDIVIPDELQEVMSLEAQADREKNARMTVAGVEAELAEMLAEAARVYGDPEAALKLRTMLMQYDTVKKSKGTVVTVPTAMSDGFTDSAMMNGDRTTER